MSKQGSDQDADKVLSSVRRLVGDVDGSGGTNASDDRSPLILSADLRVSGQGPLRLEPWQAVNTKTPRDPPVATSPTPPDGSRPAPAVKSAVDTPGDAPEKPLGAKELTAKIAALETAIAKTADQWEPDGTSRDAYSGTRSQAMSWQETIELDAKGKPLTDPADAADAQSGETRLPKDLLDEEMLRNLVGDVVRAELQGALGERITRNMRKLVRREIHRALAARDLE